MNFPYADGAGQELSPMVSVIVPLYNKADHIAATLDSALAQTFGDYEIIVVDDGSTDASSAIAQGYGDRIRYIHQNNRGAGAARNRGLAEARGRYMAFLDADDTWRPEKLAEQVAFMEAHPEIMWCSANSSQDEGCRRHNGLFLPYDPQTDEQWTCFDDWFDENTRHWIQCTSVIMVRREVFAEVGDFDAAIPSGQDMDLWIRIALCYPRIGYSNKPLAHIHSRLPGCLSLSGKMKYESTLQYLRKHVTGPECAQPERESFRRLLRHLLLVNARTVLGMGDRALAGEYLRSVPAEWRNARWCRLTLLRWCPGPMLRLGGRIRRAVFSG